MAGWRGLVYFLMVVSLVQVGAEYTGENDFIQRINYGVILKEDAKLFLAKESWLHTFQIDIPKNFQVSKGITLCEKQTQDCTNLNSLIHFITHLRQGTELHLQETIKAIHTLIPHSTMFTSKRNIRSFLPFIGSLAKGLFGTATMDDVNLLARHINSLNRKTQLIAKVLHQHGDHLSSFMSLVDNKTNNLMNGIQEYSKEISVLAHSINMSLVTLQQSMFSISKILINLTNQGNILRSKLDQFQTAVHSLVEGRISPLLLPKHTLTQALHKVQRILTDSYPGFYLTQFHPSFYYTNSNFMFIRNHSILYLTLRFPVSSHTDPLRLYKVLSLPVLVNNTFKHATKLLDLPDFFAVTHQHDYYLPLSAKQLTNCKHDSAITCNFNLALIPSHVQQCTIALFKNDMKQVKRLCNFRFLENHLTHDIIELSSTSVLVYQNKQTLLPGCRFCVINLPCKCSLATKSLYLAPRLVQCYNNTKEVSILHPVNLALLQEFFSDGKLKSIPANKLFSSQVQLSIPHFTFYKHNINNILAADQQMHLSLKKMTAAARNDSKIFKTLTELLLDGLISLQSDWPDLNAILSFASIGIGSLAILVCIYLFLKFRKMATTILVLQQIVKTKSQTIPSFIYEKITKKPEPTETSSIEKFLASEFSWLHASVILSTMVLIFLTVLVCYLYRSRKSKYTTVYIEITSGCDCVTIPLLSLSLCPSYYDFTTPSVDDISLSAFPQCKLFVIFSSFVITNKLTTKPANIPTMIGIDLFTRYKLNKIFMQSFDAYVLVTHQGFVSVLNAPISFLNTPKTNQNIQQPLSQPSQVSMYPRL